MPTYGTAAGKTAGATSQVPGMTAFQSSKGRPNWVTRLFGTPAALSMMVGPHRLTRAVADLAHLRGGAGVEDREGERGPSAVVLPVRSTPCRRR